MMIVISPAKNLDYETPVPTEEHTQPQMLKQAGQLADCCKKLAVSDLSDLMDISEKLAVLNAERFATWETPFTAKNARQAAFAFNGDVYSGLDPANLGATALT